MTKPDLRAEEYAVQEDLCEGWPVRITSYRIGQRFFAAVDNVDPGAQVARAYADTRADAVRQAFEKAHDRLARTRRA
jgi:hypothetical protein